jgi:hypothetical protein
MIARISQVILIPELYGIFRRHLHGQNLYGDFGVLQPIVAWVLASGVFGLSPLLTHTAVLLAALPTGTGPFMLAELYGREADVTSNVVLVSTVASWPPCAPTRPIGCSFPDGAPRTGSRPSRPRRRPSAPTSPAWPTAARQRRSAGGCRRWARCIGSTIWRGTPAIAPARARGTLRSHDRPVQKAAALTPPMLRQLLATCDQSARGRRDRALLLFGFVGALRRSELVLLRVEDVAVVAGGLRLRILRGKTDQAGQRRRSACCAGVTSRPCPVCAFEAWQAVARGTAGPLFRKISTGDGIGDTALHPDAESSRVASDQALF